MKCSLLEINRCGTSKTSRAVSLPSLCCPLSNGGSVLFENDKTETWEEIKRFETDVWRMKWKLTEAIFGNDQTVKLTVIK